MSAGIHIHQDNTCICKYIHKNLYKSLYKDFKFLSLSLSLSHTHTHTHTPCFTVSSSDPYKNKNTPKSTKRSVKKTTILFCLSLEGKGNIEAIKHFPLAFASRCCPSLSCCLKNNAVPNQKEVQKTSCQAARNSTFD